jgi:hypothetical protein
MSTKGKISIEAFIDQGFPEGKTFCTQFLYSPEFSSNILRALSKSGGNKTKYDLADSLAISLVNQTLSPEEILRAFVKQPRKWLSFKIGHCKKEPIFEPAKKLLTEFGKDGWYGPIGDQNSSRKWYIRTHKVPFYEKTYKASESLGANSISPVAEYKIRWTVIAEVDEHYVALSWNGFRHNELKDISDPELESLVQFPYWYHIPLFFNELSKECQADWQHIKLDQLVLYNIWDKYLGDSQYSWQHLRIRADNRGVALNAHSTGAYTPEGSDVRGLQALSRQLAHSAIKSLKVTETPEIIHSVENSLLRTLIQEWGTKSYEFSLDKKVDNKQESLFRAHCYFTSNGASSSPQDNLQHLHCFTQKYGGSSQALSFLLSELGY